VHEALHRGQLYRFYRYQHADEFSWLKHAVIPFTGSAALIVVVYYSVNPLPAWPVSLAPFIVLGWLVIGFGVLTYVYRGHRASNLALAGLAMGETPDAVAGAVSDSGQVPASDLGS
jgi:ABC-type cobalamin transport system permease subunit